MRAFFAAVLMVYGVGQVSAKDLSQLFLEANSSSTVLAINILVTDPAGRRTGRDSSGANIQEIPGASFGIDSIDNETTGEPGTSVVSFVLNQIMQGTYTVQVVSLNNAPYQVSFQSNDLTGKPVDLGAGGFITGFAVVASTQQIQLSLNPTPGATNTIIKTVSLNLLQQELETASQLDQLGGKKFVGGLEDLLAQAQKALDRKDRDDRDHRYDSDDERGKREAVERLQAFIAQIASVERERSDRDRDRDDKRFVTSTAAQSLVADAKTLIQQFGGKPERDHDEQHKSDH